MNTLLVFACAAVLGQTESEVLTEQFPRVSRQWVDSSGEFRLRATLVSATASEVVLEKEDKTTITVPLKRLDAESQTLAKATLPSFLVEGKIRGIIEQLVEDGRKTRLLDRTLIAKANQDLRNANLAIRYRITAVDEPKDGKFRVSLTPLCTWKVLPDNWENRGQPPFQSFMRAWYLVSADHDRSKVTAGESIFEISGSPQIVFPGARDFSFRGMDAKASVVQIGLGLMKHKIRVYTPED